MTVSTHSVPSERATRFDCFIIWGNGLQYSQEIMEMIRKVPQLEIVKIVRHCPGHLGDFVRQVYDRDYVPFRHLVSKTQYLLKTKSEIIAVFVRTADPRERCVGEGRFRHIESTVIKDVKEAIRDRFNPRHNGKRTEEHVVHASDHEAHTDHVLRLLGFRTGIEHLERQPNSIIHAPYHLRPFDRFRIMSLGWDQLFCHVLEDDGERPSLKRCRIEDSPHYQCLAGEPRVYEDYLERFRGRALCDDHSVDKLLALASSFRYLERPNHTRYILVRRHGRGEYVIQDGLHRASILRWQGEPNVVVAITR